MTFIIDCIYLLTAVAISPMVVYRMVRYKRYQAGWGNRLGKIARKDPQKKCIWVHAVSVGEVNASKTLVKELRDRFRDFEIVISATTDTGFARASSLFGSQLEVFYFPFDLSWIMRRAFREIQPAICLLMEQEVWPNFVHTAEKLNIPVVVVNGRISDKGFSRHRKIKPIAKKVFRKVSLVLAQTEEYAERFKEIGCEEEKVVVTGSLKYDTAQTSNKVDGTDELADQLNIKGKRLWVAGGTGNDEERILIDVYQSLRQGDKFRDLRFAVVPRKPERFEEVAQLIKQAGLPLVRYSQIKGGTPLPQQDDRAVILGDTMGDLRKFYSLATIIFVGRSLVPMGGSDMMEAAALGKCTLFGPYAFNFKQTVGALLQGQGAIQVKDKETLLQTMQKCLTDSDFAEKVAQNGRDVIKHNQGATKKTIDQIAELLTCA